MNDRPIGIFDSGIGGLTVVKEVIKALPHESIIYLGDTARVPYGPRSKEVIREFARQLTEFLLKKDIKCLVVACNTISAIALEEIKKISSVPVIGVIKPAAKKAVDITKLKKIGVIGTIGTINSASYEEEIQKLDSSVEVISEACPLFVPIAEEGFGSHQATKLIAQDYLSELKNSGIDTLILGCTHYPILIDTIKEVMGEEITLIDSAKLTAEELKKLLEEKNLLSDNPNPSLRVLVTDAPQRVYLVASRFFGEDLEGKIKKVTL